MTMANVAISTLKNRTEYSDYHGKRTVLPFEG